MGHQSHFGARKAPDQQSCQTLSQVTRRGRRPLCRGGIVGALACVMAAAASASAGQPLTWAAPVDLPHSHPLNAISCPSASLCVAGGDSGVYVSIDPTSGASAWKLVTPTNAARPQSFVHGVSCPSAKLCVAVEGRAILTTTNPTGGPSAWHATRIQTSSSRILTGVSCASASLCVTIESNPNQQYPNPLIAPRGGHVLSTTNPTGGARAWKASSVRDVPDAVSCLAPKLCLLGTRDGDVLTSTNPTAGHWATTHVFGHPGYQLTVGAVACASPRYCLAGYDDGPSFPGLLRTTNPRNTKMYSWDQVYGENTPGVVIADGSCAPTRFCAFIALTAIPITANVNATMIFTSVGPSSRNDWRTTRIRGSQLSEVACPSQRLCVAVGSAATTTAPARIVVGRR